MHIRVCFVKNEYLESHIKLSSEHEFYREKLIILQTAISEMLIRLETYRRYRTINGLRDPIEHCKARIKTAESMRAKLKRLGYEQTAEAALTDVHDAAGVRVICNFIDDVYLVAEMMRNQSDIEIFNEKDYIKQAKPNGYRSYHMIIKFPVHVMNEINSVFVELQIRTIAMDCWASLEHQLKYKKNIKNQELIISELKRCADEIASTDLTLLTIRDLIGESQAEDTV